MANAAVGYIRVSTKKQKTSGLGLAAQEESIRAFCEREGLELSRIFTETESGCEDQRPELMSALQMAKKQGGFVVVAKLCRLSRRVSLISKFMDEKVPFISTEIGTSVDPFMLHVWAAFNEAEAKKISRRTKDALKAKMDQGWKAGNPNINEVNQLGRKLQADRADEFALKLKDVVAGFQATGVNTLSGLATSLNQAGVKTARGGTWSAQTVKRLLARLERLHE